MELADVVSGRSTAFRRSGHYCVWHVDRVISFGGIPHEDDDTAPDVTMLDIDRHWCPPPKKWKDGKPDDVILPPAGPDDEGISADASPQQQNLTGEEEQQQHPGSIPPPLNPPAITTHSTFHVLSDDLQWRWVWSMEYPKSRHGHCLIPISESKVCVIGGRYWCDWDKVPSHDLIFDRTLRRWQTIRQAVIPNRFCAAVCTDVSLLDTAKYSSTYPKQVFLFGGMADNNELTSDIVRVNTADGMAQYLPSFGSRPPNQFKGTMVYRHRQRELLAFDGYHESGAQMTRSYGLDSGVWRTVCSAPPVARSQLLPVHDGRMILIFGGLRRKKPNRRQSTVYTFDTERQLWIGGDAKLMPCRGLMTEPSAEGFEAEEPPQFEPRSAHQLVVIPPAFRSSWPKHADALILGGSIERNDEPNNGGIAVGDVFCVKEKPLTLRWLVARTIDSLGMAERCATMDDDILDDLF